MALEGAGLGAGGACVPARPATPTSCGATRCMPGADAPRVAFVVPRYGREVVGGAETLCRLLAENLAGAGVPVEVLTTCAVDHFTWADHHPEGTDGGGRRAGPPLPAWIPRATTTAGSRLHTAASTCGCRPATPTSVEWMAPVGLVAGAAATRRGRGPLRLARVRCRTCSAPRSGPPRRGPERTALIPCVHDEAHAWLPAVRRDARGGARLHAQLATARGSCSRGSRPGRRTRAGERRLRRDAGPRATSGRGVLRRRAASRPGTSSTPAGARWRKGLPSSSTRTRGSPSARPDAPAARADGPGRPAPRRDAIADRVIDLGFVPGRGSRGRLRGGERAGEPLAPREPRDGAAWRRGSPARPPW